MPGRYSVIHRACEHVVCRSSSLAFNTWEDLGMIWVLPHITNSWIISIIWSYIALNRTPDIDCYWGGGSTQGMIILNKGAVLLRPETPVSTPRLHPRGLIVAASAGAPAYLLGIPHIKACRTEYFSN